MVTCLLDAWPITGRSMECVKGHEACYHMDHRQQALGSLLKLPAAHCFAASECLALATAAAKAGSLDAFTELCRGLPQMREAHGEMPVHLLLRMYQLAVDKRWCEVDSQHGDQMTRAGKTSITCQVECSDDSD